MRFSSGAWAALVLALASWGCTGTPSPLAPGLRGSVGVPHYGVLTDGVALPKKGDGYVRFRDDGVHYANPRLISAIESAAEYVATERPGSPPLVVADLSERFGGKTDRHRSHRTGRDADLLLYATTADGRPVRAPGFVPYGKDGLAFATVNSRRVYLRIDTERNWLLVKGLLQADDANMQWLFVARWLEAMLVEYAIARGEDLDLVWRAETMLRQPSDSAAHADHFHIRIACTPAEAAAGCEGGGPRWPWLPALPDAVDDDEALLGALLGDLLAPS